MVGVAVLRGKMEMEEAVVAVGEVCRMVAGVPTFMREARVELRVMDLVPAMVVIKGIMFLLMEFFGLDRAGSTPAAAIGIMGSIIGQMFVGNTVTMATIMLDVRFLLAMQIIMEVMGWVGMLPMSQA
jgi:hypothetical protein